MDEHMMNIYYSSVRSVPLSVRRNMINALLQVKVPLLLIIKILNTMLETW